jgi:hypothetical protein
VDGLSWNWRTPGFIRPTRPHADRAPTAVSRVYVGVVLGVLAISTLVIIHDSVYAAIPWTDGRWITLILNPPGAIFRQWLAPETLLLLTNVGWWLYAWLVANQSNLTSLKRTKWTVVQIPAPASEPPVRGLDAPTNAATHSSWATSRWDARPDIDAPDGSQRAFRRRRARVAPGMAGATRRDDRSLGGGAWLAATALLAQSTSSL